MIQELRWIDWKLGPYHAWLPAPMVLRLKLEVETIVQCEVETGFLYKGLEKVMETRSWQAAIVYADHLDPESAVFGELVLCMAVEEMVGLPVPPRAQFVRMILVELTRICAHLAFLVRIAKAVHSEVILHYLLRDREKILDLFELLAGARFSLNFLRFGGVCTDMTEGFLERVLEICDNVHIRMREYNDLFIFNDRFLNRTLYLGVLEPHLVLHCGVTGPNARASGFAWDVRKQSPSMSYEMLDFTIPLGTEQRGFLGDVHDRVVVRLEEMAQSAEILKQLIEAVPSGEYLHEGYAHLDSVAAGEAYVRVESARGVLGCHLVSDGSSSPLRVQFRPPSMAHLMALPSLLQGLSSEDLPLVLASLDIGVAEVDR